MTNLAIPRCILIFIISNWSLLVFSQGLAAFSIADSLEDNANAVVRSHSTSIVIKDLESMTVSEKVVITVLNENADYLLQYGKVYDDATKIEELTGTVYNEMGIEINSFKKKDIEDISLGGAGVSISDSRAKFMTYTPAAYPVTVEFYSKVNSKNTGFIPTWSAHRGFNVSTEESTFSIQNNSGTPLNHKLIEGYADIDVDIKESPQGVSLSVSNLKAISEEYLSPSYYDITTQLVMALDDFVLFDVRGQGGDWETFGKWYHDALLDQGLRLEPDVINAVRDLVKGVSDPRQKAQKVYEYVQGRTRYISIQLGIGGWKPYPAQEVHDLAYGDCKGLTHYTRALLRAVDVEALLAVVHAGRQKRDFTQDFTRMQGNHVILCLPNLSDTTWLECTSQTSPFGHIGQFTDDRDVLLVTPTGGKIVHTKNYTEHDNVRRHTAEIIIDETGTLSAELKILSQGIFYDRSRLYLEEDEKDQKEYFLKEWGDLNRLNIVSMNDQIDRANGTLTEMLTLETTDYARVANDQIVIRLNPFDVLDNVIPRLKNRRFPMELRDSKSYTNEFVISIPEGFRINSIPDEVKLETNTGRYNLKVIDLGGGKLKYERTFVILDGLYPSDEYKEHRNFLKAVKKYDNQKISISNKS